MGRKKSYDNVSQQRFACMKSVMRSRVQEFASNNNYRISIWNVPDSHDATWHICLKGNVPGKPDLDFAARVSLHNQNLSIEMLRMPIFISSSRAIEEMNSVYRSCKA